MHPRLLKLFRDDFPEIKGLGDDIEVRCMSGWGLLLYCFFKDVSDACQKNGGEVRLRQIKEKFGTLRIYCSYVGGSELEVVDEFIPEAYGRLISLRPYPSNPTISTLINYYEQASSSICEICGNSGHADKFVTSKIRWVSTLCFEHALLMVESNESNEDIDFDAIEDAVAARIENEIADLKSGSNSRF